MAFTIRRNQPYNGAVTLTQVSVGAFKSKDIVLSESEFLKKVMRYVDSLSPADAERLRRVVAAEPEEPAQPFENGNRKFKLRKPAEVAAAQ